MVHQVALIFGTLWVLRYPADGAVRAVALAGALFALSGGAYTYAGDPFTCARLFAWMPLGIWLTCIETRHTRPLWLLLPAGLWPFLLAGLCWLPRLRLS